MEPGNRFRTSPETMVRMSVVLRELGYDQEINVYGLGDQLPDRCLHVTRHDDTRVRRSESDRYPHFYRAANDPTGVGFCHIFYPSAETMTEPRNLT